MQRRESITRLSASTSASSMKLSALCIVVQPLLPPLVQLVEQAQPEELLEPQAEPVLLEPLAEP